VFLLITSLLMMRLNKGADLGDESYYALYVDDWLKGDIGSSTYLVLHQTAALLVFPFAWLYRRRGSPRLRSRTHRSPGGACKASWHEFLLEDR